MRAVSAALAMLVVHPAHAYTVEVLQAEGDPANRVDLCILGDGYRDQDQTQLSNDANAFLTELFAATPFQQYEKFFNAKLVHVISNENGADNGSYGAIRDTALGAYYNCNGVDRLICVDGGAVYSEAGAHVPEYDHILVIVNDPKYGGSGGSFAVFSIHSSAGEIAIHELGHSFSGLADEYEDPYPGYPPCGSDCPEPNATNRTTFAQIKWNAWIDAATPLPTPETAMYVDAVGAFEGCRYEPSGVFRPKQSCRMRSLGNDFCPVCSEASILATYSIVDPIDGASPASAQTIAADGGVLLAVTRPLPTPDTDIVTWSVDGTTVLVGPDAYAADGVVLGPGDHTVVGNVTDETALVRSDPSGLLASERTWTVTVCDGPLDPGGANACGGACALAAAVGAACDGSDLDGCADDVVECAGVNATACSAGADNPDPCDGADNDCDGTIDNDGSNACGGSCGLGALPGTACDGADTDLCLDDVVACTAPNATVCPAGADNGDACDGTDEDCDGTIDNGGSNACGGSCALAAFPGSACDGPDSDDCSDDRVGCTALNATDCSTGADNGDACDGADNDCDGTIDNDGSNACRGSCALTVALGTPCDGADGDGCEDDVTQCAGINDTTCSLGPNDPERCDGLDNDCDGSVDQGFDVGASCTVGMGACQAAGTLRCAVAGDAVVCDGQPSTPTIEVCNGVDDDCDGLVDNAEKPCSSVADDGGCGCRVGSSAGPAPPHALLGLLVVLVLPWSRRRRPGVRGRSPRRGVPERRQRLRLPGVPERPAHRVSHHVPCVLVAVDDEVRRSVDGPVAHGWMPRALQERLSVPGAHGLAVLFDEPLCRPLIDQPGRRYGAEDTLVWSFFARGMLLVLDPHPKRHLTV